MKLRTLVTTDISLRSTAACAATIDVCSVWPWPAPLRSWYPTIRAVEECWSRVESKPRPTAQMAYPTTIEGLYSPVRETSWPERKTKTVVVMSCGMMRTPERVGESPRTTWKYCGR